MRPLQEFSENDESSISYSAHSRNDVAICVALSLLSIATLEEDAIPEPTSSTEVVVPLGFINCASTLWSIAGRQMVLSVEPVVVLHVVGAESFAASVPESWAISPKTTPQVRHISFALTESFSTAAFHLACAVGKSEVLLLVTFWWGEVSATIGAVVS
jgi:hypothetical protein